MTIRIFLNSEIADNWLEPMSSDSEFQYYIIVKKRNVYWNIVSFIFIQIVYYFSW